MCEAGWGGRGESLAGCVGVGWCIDACLYVCMYVCMYVLVRGAGERGYENPEGSRASGLVSGRELQWEDAWVGIWVGAGVGMQAWAVEEGGQALGGGNMLRCVGV